MLPFIILFALKYSLLSQGNQTKHGVEQFDSVYLKWKFKKNHHKLQVKEIFELRNKFLSGEPKCEATVLNLLFRSSSSTMVICLWFCSWSITCFLKQLELNNTTICHPINFERLEMHGWTV